MGELRFGKGLKRLREVLGLSQTELAARIGAKAHTISQIESGARSPSLDMIYRLAAALDVEPGAFWSEDEEPSVGGGRSGLVKSVTLETVFNNGSVTGADVYLKAPPDSPYAGLRKALKLSHLHRAGKPDYRTVELAGVPPGSILIDCRTPLEVRVEGVVKQLHPAGTILVADPEKEPEPEDLVLAVYMPEPDPTGEDLSKSESYAQIRRFEPGPRNIPLLFSLERDEAVVAGGDWQVVATVVDFRFTRP